MASIALYWDEGFGLDVGCGIWCLVLAIWRLNGKRLKAKGYHSVFSHEYLNWREYSLHVMVQAYIHCILTSIQTSMNLSHRSRDESEFRTLLTG